MQVFNNIETFSCSQPTVLTIGTFDGFHIGHKKIIERLTQVATHKNLNSVVLTFFPHPRMVLQKDSDLKLIHTINERVKELNTTNLDHLIIHPFSKDFSRLSAKNFVQDILVNQLNIKHIIIGYDHRFGKNRTANINDLKDFGELYGFVVEEISAQDCNDVTVSSTKIRTALLNGEIEKANLYLGSPFQLNGVVSYGKGLGKTINYPTANIEVEEDYKLIPKNGVYIAQAMVNNHTYYGMMNIGTNPTVNGKHRSIEIHLFNFNQDIYNNRICVSFCKRIRDEKKFNSIKDLQQQLALDQQVAETFINHVE